MKISAFGEIMLRLTPPEYLLLEQTDILRMCFTGTGVNLLANLAHFGCDTAIISALPDNRLGYTARASMARYGIGTDFLTFAHDHIGSYFAEVGYGARPTQVTYQNRLQSSFGKSGSGTYNFDEAVASADMIHICGIALSLTDETRESAFALAEKTVQAGKKLCFDFNFRPSLNTEADKKAFMKQQYERMLPFCDIVFGSRRDLVELLGMDAETPEDELIYQFMRRYNIEWFAGTKRSAVQGEKTIQGHLWSQSAHASSGPLELKVLDRIGAGDGFAAGIIYGLAEGWPQERTVEFASMNTILAHTLQGDVPLTSVSEVLFAMEHPGADLIR